MERYYYKCVVLLLVLIVISPICLRANSNVPCIEQERQALLDFKASLIDGDYIWKGTAYRSSNRLTSWKGTYCCRWEGVGCDNVTGHVVKLDLRNPCYPPVRRQQRTVYPYFHYNLDDDDMLCLSLYAPNVSTSLLQLEHLTYLDLTGNYFGESSIPMFIGSMGRLEHLSLSQAGFSGNIPISLANLKSLQYLDLNSNYDFSSLILNGNTTWISKLRSLKHLDLSSVFINDKRNFFQVLNLLSSLLHLSLPICQLDNSLIPPHAFQNITSLVYLDLSFNMLSSPILESFQNMTSIESLHLAGNNFTLLPSWLCNFKKLTHLDLSGNSITSIPSRFVDLKRLVYLDLSSNQLTLRDYFLSSIINSMCRLKDLILSGNKLYIESMEHFEISKCIRYDLEYLELGDNHISGHLPTWLEKLENLKYLDFTSNYLHGPIPLSIGKLSKLHKLHLSNNTFEGLIPESIGQLVNLTDLDLSSNKFHGSIPQNLWKLANLENLNLSKNSFNGLIPESIGQLVNLTDLDLSSNKFHGLVPQNLGKLANLASLDLSNNSFNGVIPESLCQLVNLGYLDISSNMLEGMMSMEKGCHLNMLNLSHNQISGSLPKNIGHIMGYLFLGNNNLNGSIPFSLCQSQLSVLDLSNNKLAGEIPNCWENSQGMSEINLSSNKLTGALPSSLGNLPSLLWLHLNNNSLQGEFPTSFTNLNQLLILDLGENQLSGSIPSSWTVNTFTSLQVLRLRQNMLTGCIPSQLCQLKSLKILDLSRNKLQGSIPRCIGHLEGMILEQPISMQSSKVIAEALHEWSNEGFIPITIIGDNWSEEGAKEGMKGVDLEYTKILELVVNMDLSQNKLVGFIPDEITWLTGLHGLNLSRNQLKGEIPGLIGDMKSLESLDMSHNQLSGKIPNTMSAITSLSHLNLSHNNLSGPIPKDYQFSTFDPSIYAYNPYLCGSPLTNMCPGDGLHGASESKGNEDEDEDGIEKVWFYFVIALGFGTGFWGVIGTLWFKKKWRHAYFRWVEDVGDDIYVAIVIKVAKIKKKMKRNHGSE